MGDKETVRSLLQQARQIRQKSRTSCVSLQNYLLYQQLNLESKTLSLLSCSLCAKPKSETSRQFQRAFKTMSRVQQAHFYLMNVKNVQNFLAIQSTKAPNQNPAQQQQLPLNGQQIIKIKLQAKDGINLKTFTQVDAQIIRKQKVIKFVQMKQGIDLHAYLMRKSRGKVKNCVVLQSTEPYTTAETIRLCFSGIDFQDSFNIIFHIWEQAQYDNIRKLLIEDSRYPRRSTAKVSALRSTFQIDQFQPVTSRLVEKNPSIQNQKMLKSGINTKQGFNSSKRLAKIQKSLVSTQLLQSLNTFVDFNEQSFGIYFHKSSPKVRKIFTLLSKDIPLQKVLLSIDDIRHIRRRKQNIKQMKHLNSITSQRTNLYKQIDQINIENKQFQFVYLRHCFRKGQIVYFYEKSVELEDFKEKQKSNQEIYGANILYCIWRIKQIGEKIQIVVQAEIQYKSKIKNVHRATSEYIGQFNQFVKRQAQLQKKQKKEQLNEEKSIQSQQFQNEYLSQISNDQQFFTVTGSLHSSQKDAQQYENMLPQQKNIELAIPMKKTKLTPVIDSILIPLQQHQKLVQQITSKQTAEQTSQPTNDVYLRIHHQIVPKAKGNPNYMRQESGHLLFGKDWIISGSGELVNVNKEMIKVQSSVLKLVLQRMGKNLLAGKSIMNMSLPIEIFGTDSNLQRIARGYIYAPIFLEKAAKSTNPIERLVNVFCFGLGFSTSYIRMQKPFNPVLGETYQGIIDGCPVYGQQISHHPPISSMLMIGRGYRVFGNFQAKVEMGFNSASGINDGFNTIQFADGGVLKFNTPPGEIQGVIMGDRKLTLVKKSYYIDKKNKLFCQINWGRKKSNPRSQSSLNDFFSGKVVRVLNSFKLDEFKNIKSKDYEEQLGQIHGRFTGKVYFDDKLVFDLNNDPPYYIDDYGPCLPSDSRLRNDIIQRKKNNFNTAQDAKEAIQEIQRNDRKLRSAQH